MSRTGEPVFEYQVFDWYSSRPYAKRVNEMADYWETSTFREPHQKVKLILPEWMDDVEALEYYEADCLEGGYEGVMVRTANSPYKFGRSTEKEGYLLKIKRFVDGDAVIIGTEEKMHNDNPAEQDELGRTKRSSHKANQIPMNTLGALLVEDTVTKVQFRIGTGFDDETRKMLWGLRLTILGKIVKYKSQSVGVKVAPRFPVYLGMRSAIEVRDSTDSFRE
jgi:DNA ligase-1